MGMRVYAGLARHRLVLKKILPKGRQRAALVGTLDRHPPALSHVPRQVPQGTGPRAPDVLLPALHQSSNQRGPDPSRVKTTLPQLFHDRFIRHRGSQWELGALRSCLVPLPALCMLAVHAHPCEDPFQRAIAHQLLLVDGMATRWAHLLFAGPFVVAPHAEAVPLGAAARRLHLF